MKYVLAVGLTLFASWSIIELNKYNILKNAKIIRHKQSDIHQIIISMVPKKLNTKKDIESQSAIHAANTMIKIIVIESKAYWVKDNIFYCAETDSGDVVESTVATVDVLNMSKKDMDKMLFILDNLRKGKQDDSSSSGNE